jgi:hypothetical protein
VVGDDGVAVFDALHRRRRVLAHSRGNSVSGRALWRFDSRKKPVFAVHRLRAVTCLYGFTRLEPAATYTEEMLEDVRLTVAGAAIRACIVLVRGGSRSSLAIKQNAGRRRSDADRPHRSRFGHLARSASVATCRGPATADRLPGSLSRRFRNAHHDGI